MNLQLLSLLERAFGKHQYVSNNNYYFYSPFQIHRKPKLAIKLIPDKQGNYKWNCWLSNNGGYNLYTLFAKSNLDYGYFQELKNILNDTKYLKFNYNTKETSRVILPNGFIELINDDSTFYHQKIVNYLLKKRKITEEDVVRYKIGYTYNLTYSNYTIIPSYDKDYNLNYYYCRSILKTMDKKHIIPNTNKDVIVFEHLISNNNPIVLCEGIFDAISIRTNAIPLMGKTINDYLLDYIYTNNIKDIILCLDPDAIRNTIGYLNLFVSIGLNTYMCDLKDKDPSEHGNSEMKHIIENSKLITRTDLLRLKVKYGIKKNNTYI